MIFRRKPKDQSAPPVPQWRVSISLAAKIFPLGFGFGWIAADGWLLIATVWGASLVGVMAILCLCGLALVGKEIGRWTAALSTHERLRAVAEHDADRLRFDFALCEALPALAAVAGVMLGYVLIGKLPIV